MWFPARSAMRESIRAEALNCRVYSVYKKLGMPPKSTLKIKVKYMGEVKTRVLLRNYVSVGASKRGYLSEKDIESSELDMIVDTGAVMILLPQDEVEKLGLEPSKKVVVT